MIYLDNAATTLVKPPEVTKAIVNALSTCGNAGRGAHTAALTASDVLFSCREEAGKLFGQPDVDQIVFTQNTTHALNLAIFGTMRQKGHCLISGYEHNSVIRPLHALKPVGVTYTAVRTPLFEQEQFLNEFVQGIRNETKYAVCTHVSNVFGYILPIKEIDEICWKHGISLIIDAAQSAGCIPIDFSALKATVCLCVPGHKGLYGPQGTGLLICRNGEQLEPFMYGGTGSASKSLQQPEFMPDRHESGTQNIHGIAGLKEGITYVRNKGETTILASEKTLIQYAAETLAKIEGIKVYFGPDQAGVLAFTSDRFLPETIVDFLGENQIAVRGGLHCSPIAHETVGTVDGCVRISVSDFNSFDDIDKLVEWLKKI